MSHAEDPSYEITTEDLNKVEGFSRAKEASVLVIFFDDMKGSTALKQKITAIQDEEAFQTLRREHDALLTRIISRDGAGAVIKSTGDGLLAIFAEPSTAVERAIEIQEALRHHPYLSVRIGLDMGQVRVEAAGGTKRDLFGRHVDWAARAESLADGGHIIVTRSVYVDAFGWIPKARVQWKEHGFYIVKEGEDAIEAFEPYNSNITVPMKSLRGRLAKSPTSTEAPSNHFDHQDADSGATNTPTSSHMPTSPRGPVGEVRCFKGHTSYVYSAAFCPDARHFVSSSLDGTIRLWDVDRGQTVRRFEPAKATASIAVSPDGRYTVSGDSRCIQLWNVATGQEVHLFEGEGRAVAFSPDGCSLASGGGSGTVYLWVLSTGQKACEFRGHTEPVESVAFAPDGLRLVSAARERTIYLWHISTPQPIQVLRGHTNSVYCVAFSPDGSKVLSGSADASLRLWEAETGKTLRHFEGHEWTVLSVAFSPSGRWIVSGSADKTARVWDVESGKEVCCFKHKGNVNSVALSPDGRFVLSAGEDYTIRLWRLLS